MKRLNIFLGLIGGLLMSSCNLDVELYDKIGAEDFPENGAQLESIILGAYAPANSLVDDWGWWLYMQEVTSDVLVFPQRGTDWEDGGKWRVLHRHTWNSTTAGVQGMWSWLNRGVVASNKALEFFKADNEQAANVRAELRVLRSYYYYLLIDNYGAVAYSEEVQDADAYPYRVKRGAIANRLIQVIEEELVRLPEAGTVAKSRVTKPMAYMLLSKLYLNKHIYEGVSSPSAEDMNQVANYTNMVINAGYSLTDNRLEPFAVDNSNCPENIFMSISDETGADGMRLNFRTLHTLHQQTYDLISTPWNGCAVKPSFYDNLFAANDGFDNPDDINSGNDEVVDQRASAFLKGQQFDIDGNELSNDNGAMILTKDLKADVMDDAADGGATTRFGGYRMAKYEIEIGGQPIMNNDFPIFRLADAYLMRAEATLRGASTAEAGADADLNTIREAAGLPSTTATLEEVLDERGRELMVEGHRRSDLIRFGEFADRDWWLGADESDPGVHRLTFPYPESASQTNPNFDEAPIDLEL